MGTETELFDSSLTNQDLNEEAHGLWEFAIVRLAAFAEVGASREVLSKAVKAEREAFHHWQSVCRRITG